MNSKTVSCAATTHAVNEVCDSLRLCDRQDHDFCDSLRLSEQPYLEFCNRLRLCDRTLSFVGDSQELRRFYPTLHERLRLCDDLDHELHGGSTTMLP